MTSNEPIQDSAVVYEQFEDIEQQQQSYTLGMWAFIVTEVMFFGALFVIYALYRFQYQEDFYLAHKQLNVTLGGINTTILLTSSLSMALAVHFAQVKKVRAQIGALVFTLICAFAFLVVKTIEYAEKIAKDLLPGPFFQANPGGGDPGRQELFFSLYFAITGIHALHIIIGIVVIGALTYLIIRKSSLITDYVPTEMVGLYWHFVDLVWIFLFPLFYLMPR